MRVLNFLYLQIPKGGICTPAIIFPAIDTMLDISNDTYLSLVYQLLEKDFVTSDMGVYQIYDKLFELWIRRQKYLA